VTNVTTLSKGDQGVIIRKSGRIDSLLYERGPVDEIAQALLAAAFQIKNDPAFRQKQVEAFRLYHAQVEGFA
jgi:hypothetical protein